jgi:hypothetical protein
LQEGEESTARGKGRRRRREEKGGRDERKEEEAAREEGESVRNIRKGREGKGVGG